MMMNEAPKLHHEQLDAYKAPIEFLALATTLLANYPKGNGVLTDQLRRASLSIPLNIAEGYDKRTTPDRRCGSRCLRHPQTGVIDDPVTLSRPQQTGELGTGSWEVGIGQERAVGA